MHRRNSGALRRLFLLQRGVSAWSDATALSVSVKCGCISGHRQADAVWSWAQTSPADRREERRETTTDVSL
jgi:hypothetical protein